jgi:EmrB/QacA subfamily drug resistance transporter
MNSNNVLELEPGTTRPATSLREGWKVLIALLLALLVVTVDNTVLNVALPSISADLHAGTSELQWIVNAYSLLFGGLLLTGGSVADRLGRRRILIGGLIAFAGASALVFFVASAPELIALRALSGAAAAFLMPSTIALMYRAFEGPARATAIGIAGAVAALGFAAGPVLGGGLLQILPWQAVFAINVPIAMVAVPLARTVIPADPERAGGRADVPGTALSVLAMGGLVAALIDGPEHGWTSAAVLIPALATIVAGTGFVLWELRAPHPMLDVRAVGRRTVTGPGAAQGALLFAVAGILFLLTQLLQVLDGYSPVEAGLRAAPIAVGLIGGGPVLTRSARLGTSRAAALGLLIAAVGIAGAAYGIAHGYLALAVGLVVLGVGVRITVTIAALAVLDGLPSEAAGMGAALGDAFQEIGGALGVALLGSIFNAVYRAELPSGAPDAARSSLQGALSLHDAALAAAARHAFTSGAQVALLVCAAILAVMALVARLTVPAGLDLTEDPAPAGAVA